MTRLLVGIDPGRTGAADYPQRIHARLDGLRTTNPLNQRTHWRTVSRRVQTEHARTVDALSWGRLPALPVRVTITRVSPGRLDPVDALGPALKGVRDAVAWMVLGRRLLPNGKPAWGVGDEDPRIEWVLDQRKEGPKVYAVEVTIEAVGSADAAGMALAALEVVR